MSRSPWEYDAAPINVGLLEAGIATAQNTATQTATLLTQLMGNNDAGSSGGITVAEDFTTYPAGPLGDQWVPESGAADAALGVYVPTGSGFDNNEGIYGPVAWWLTNAPGGLFATEDYWQRHVTPLATDSASIRFVVGTNGKTDVETHVFCHADTNLANMMRVSIRNNRFWWGNATFSGGVFSFNDWNSGGTAVSIPNGAICELRNQGTNWTFYVNNSLKITKTDAAGDVLYDASHRHWGFAIEQRNQFLAMTEIGFGLSSIIATDVEVPTFLRHGWKLYRNAPGGHANSLNAASAATPFPNDCFDSVVPESTVEVNQLGTGEVIIPVTGRWLVRTAVVLNNGLGSSWYRPILYMATAPGQPTWQEWTGPDYANSSNLRQLSGFAVIYLGEGYVIRPGYITNTIGNRFIGATEFSGVYIPHYLGGLSL